jgi:hypothetical protein
MKMRIVIDVRADEFNSTDHHRVFLLKHLARITCYYSEIAAASFGF